MRPRVLLPLLLLALGTGYVVGLVVTLREQDRAAAAGPAGGPAARAALEALRARAAAAPQDAAARAADRQAFLARWPSSWLRLRWKDDR